MTALPEDHHLGWRRRASWGALGLLVGWALGLPLHAWAPAAAWIQMVIALSTWHLTALRPDDSRGMRALAWALRILTLLNAVRASWHWLALVTGREAVTVEFMMTALAVVSVPLGMAYVSRRLDSLGVPVAARRARLLVWVLGAGESMLAVAMLLQRAPRGPHLYSHAGGAVLLTLLGALLLLLSVPYAFLVVFRLRGALRVVSHEWWLDGRSLPQGDWVSCAKLADQRVELRFADGECRRFSFYREALDWLFANHFRPAELNDRG